MNSRTRTGIVAVLGVWLILPAWQGVRAEVFFQEDWEGGADGLSVTNPPYNWTPDGGDNASVSDDTPFPTLAFDGDTGNTSGNVNFWKSIPSPLAGDSNYVLTAQAWLHPAGTWDGTGAARGGIRLKDGSGNNSAAINWNLTQWKFDTLIDGVYHQAFYPVGAGTNEIVDVTIRLDLVAEEATATLAYGGGTLDITKDFGASFLETIERIEFWSDPGNGSWPPGGALKVDNIQIGRTLADVPFTEVAMDDAAALWFQSGFGEHYRLQALSSPTDESWTDTGLTVVGTGYDMLVLDADTGGAQKLYRLERAD